MVAAPCDECASCSPVGPLRPDAASPMPAVLTRPVTIGESSVGCAVVRLGLLDQPTALGAAAPQQVTRRAGLGSAALGLHIIRRRAEVMPGDPVRFSDDASAMSG